MKVAGKPGRAGRRRQGCRRGCPLRCASGSGSCHCTCGWGYAVLALSNSKIWERWGETTTPMIECKGGPAPAVSCPRPAAARFARYQVLRAVIPGHDNCNMAGCSSTTPPPPEPVGVVCMSELWRRRTRCGVRGTGWRSSATPCPLLHTDTPSHPGKVHRGGAGYRGSTNGVGAGGQESGPLPPMPMPMTATAKSGGRWGTPHTPVGRGPCTWWQGSV